MRYRVTLSDGTRTSLRFTTWRAAFRWAAYRNMGIYNGTITGPRALDVVYEDGSPVRED